MGSDRLRSRGWPQRLVGIMSRLAIVLIQAAIAAWHATWHAAWPATPDAFYAHPLPPDALPAVILSRAYRGPRLQRC